jgi:hypothetical protein
MSHGVVPEYNIWHGGETTMTESKFGFSGEQARVQTIVLTQKGVQSTKDILHQ